MGIISSLATNKWICLLIAIPTRIGRVYIPFQLLTQNYFLTSKYYATLNVGAFKQV